MEKRRLREVILDQIEAKDLKVKDVIEKTGIPESYLDAVLNDKRDKLPAFPYIRIYLIKIAELLGMNASEVVAEYKREFSDKVSGSRDTLPRNRFALPSSRKRYLIVGGVLALIILTYTLTNSGFFGRPHLLLTMPPQDSEDVYVIETPVIQLAGQIESGDKLLINDQEIPVSSEGVFSLEYPLEPELNTIEFTVSRFLGKEIQVTRHVYYKEPQVAESSSLSPLEGVVAGETDEEAVSSTEAVTDQQ